MDINEIISAAKEGRVIVLPCKPDAMVYEVRYNTSACAECKDYRSGGYGADDYCSNLEMYPIYPDFCDQVICPKHTLEVRERPFNPVTDCFRFGKTVFSSRVEAEAAVLGVYDGSTVRVAYEKRNGKSFVEMVVSFIKWDNGHVSICGQEKDGDKMLIFGPSDINKTVFPVSYRPHKSKDPYVTVEFDGAFGFPVMIGDTIYLPARDDLGGIIRYNVIKIGVNNFGPFFVIDDEDKEELPIEDIGKDVFLTEKDAEEFLESSKENE